MSDDDAQFCPWCGYRVYLHSSAGDCETAERKADLVERFWGPPS